MLLAWKRTYRKIMTRTGKVSNTRPERKELSLARSMSNSRNRAGDNLEKGFK